jgi:hypothetical protein
MKKTRIHISVDGDGLIVENVNGANIDESLKVICRKITDFTGVTFSGRVEGNVDDEDRRLKVLFSEEISEELGDKIDSLLSEINGTSLTYIQTVEPEDVTRAAQEVYLLFNDFIRDNNNIPDEAMSAWDTLGNSLGHIK